MGKCKLCLQEKPLLKKSHIIPEFMYQDLYDENHKMLVMKPAERARGEGHIKMPSKGEYESGILCENCDNKILSTYESYTSKAIYGGVLPTNECPSFKFGKTQDGLVFTNASNLDYKKIKLCLLSILWRAGISKRDFFSEVELGEHEDKLRNMIFSGNPGNVDDYPILFATMVNDKNAPWDLIAQPQVRKSDTGQISFIFIIGGMIYFFYLTSKEHPAADVILTETVKPTNELNIYHIPEGRSMDLILGFFGLKDKPKQ